MRGHNRPHKHIAASSLSTPSPSSTRISELKGEREEAFHRLRDLDRAIRRESSGMQQEGRTNDDLSPLGYIRQFSGEAYDQSKAMGVPGGVLEMGAENFIREGRALLASLGIQQLPKLLRGPVGAPLEDSEAVKAHEELISKLTLSNDKIWEREKARPPIKSPWVIKVPYYILCFALDVLFDKRPIQRLWLLETVARMPYFSYISLLHFYETLGWWRRSLEARKVHFAEEWNEAHHLLIMEALGGDRAWIDRFIAQHSAIVYYLVLHLLWFMSPTLAYNFSELIEAHAVDTYAQFVDENESILKQLPPPRIARIYYEGDENRFLFEEFQTEHDPRERTVAVSSLYDVFCNIRDDEGEHVATMRGLQDQDVLERSPNIEALAFGLVLLLLGAGKYFGEAGEMGGGEAEGAGAAADAALGPVRQLVEFIRLDAIIEFLVSLLPFL